MSDKLYHEDARPWRALVTGSRAYGIPKHRSDIDLVVLVSLDDLDRLKEMADKVEFVRQPGGESDGSGEISSGSFRFGMLNLIAVTDSRAFKVWQEGTAFLKTKAPVSREQATKYLRKKRTKEDVH